MKTIAALLVILLLPACANTNFSNLGDRYTPGKRVFFIEPKDGAGVAREFDVLMGVKGMEVRPAGKLEDDTGHFHLLIDTKPIEEGELIPTTGKHLHFGKGQTRATLKLAPGKHTLILQFADGKHISYGEKMRSTVTVTVKE
ncbi:MAG: DUF4399 domain-containing protein [Gammaproteobacteria bacterium]|nr:MAG: DUF4399 domain-containing protein [Gammaproteobacteria bacterium]